METKSEHIPLTSSEISSLWTAYQELTIAICGIRFFLQHIEDKEIQEVLENTLSLVESEKSQIAHIFHDENYPVPQGFTEKDVNLSAPRLFSDQLYLAYIFNLTKLKIPTVGLALMGASRSDIITYFSESLEKAQSLHIRTKKLQQEKGIYIRAPFIPTPNQVDFVEKQTFLAGWFADRRPLLGTEIASIVFNAERNALGQAVITGFSQVAKSKEVRNYFERGREISGKHLDIFASILHEDYLSDGALLLTPQVTNSTEAPFSDKLMMTLVTTLIASGIGQYGISVSTSPRRDLGVHYARLIAELTKYSNDGAEILINNGWMEQPPMAANRKDLAK